jgi:putative CocE/NonD family hydrolase
VSGLRVERDVVVRTRDGVGLATDVYVPDADQPSPAILVRTPYGRDLSLLGSDLATFTRAGYAIVIQDTRGRSGSEGSFNPFAHERDDGADVITWIAAQDWCNGDVAMIGSSYYGATQWLAAAAAPDALRAIVPQITSDSYYEGWCYQGGALHLGFLLYWTLGLLVLADVARMARLGQPGAHRFGEVIAALDGIEELYRKTPLIDQLPQADLAPYYGEWLSHPSYDGFWQATAPRERYADVTVPSFNIGGWYDLFLPGTLRNYVGMKAAGGSPAARRPRLMIGPWAHGLVGGEFPTWRFGTSANSMMAGITGMQLKFLDHHLKGEPTELEERPVRLFVMGSNSWRDELDWPLPDTDYRRFYLHSKGRAGAALDDGSLSAQSPHDEPPDAYLYDPRDPVPTLGGATFLPGFLIGANSGPRDQQLLERRRDILCFTTATLDRDLEVTGPVTLLLFASSSATDTDFTGKLVDVHPDGQAILLTDGILRARYRDSTSAPEALQPGTVYELKIDLQATSNVFMRGHRLRLEISSSNFPRFDRNTNSGGIIARESECDFVTAVNHVFHDDQRPSHLVLPVIDRG